MFKLVSIPGFSKRFIAERTAPLELLEDELELLDDELLEELLEDELLLEELLDDELELLLDELLDDELELLDDPPVVVVLPPQAEINKDAQIISHIPEPNPAFVNFIIIILGSKLTNGRHITVY